MTKTCTKFKWLVTMLLLVTAMAMPEMAWAEITPTKPSSGDGTSANPYQIGTPEELFWFAALVKGDTSVPEVSSANTGACATLTADITVNTDLLTSLNEYGSIKDGTPVENWTPIGNNQNPFTGTFDGQGHTISGLYFNDSNTNYVGLFGFNNGTIKNVGVVDSYFCGNDWVGSVCGYQGYSLSYNTISISNCYSTGKVSGNSYVGGVCGDNNKCKITDCYNTGTVSGNSYVGGVCGYNDSYGTITGCYNTGTVSGSGKYVGGVCGDDNSGTITGCYNIGTVSGYSYVGGVCGVNSNAGEITGCYNTGTVSGSGKYVGGVCGYNMYATITGCYTNNGGVYGDIYQGTATDCYVKVNDDFTNNSVCSLLNTALKNANASVRFYQGVSYPELMNFPALVEGVYQISNKGELYAFALLVNNGETSANAVLTKDITVNTGVLKSDGTLAGNYSDFETWTPIGSKDVTYEGTFDGQGHTISGLYFNNSEGDVVGLFGGNQGTIKNVGVVDSYFCGNDWVGGVCGYNTGTITGCYNTGTVIGSSNVGGVCGYNNDGTITSCYYLANNDDGNGGKTTEQFKSGEVCYLLNGSSPYGEWGQQIGTNDYPIGSAYKVLRAVQDGQESTNYWATFSNWNSNAELMASTGKITAYNATVSGGTLTLAKRSDNKVALGEGVLLKANCEYVNAMNISEEVSAATTGENHLVATPATEQTINAETDFTLYSLAYNNSTEKTGLGFYLGVVGDVKDGSQLKATPGKAYLNVYTPGSEGAPIRGFVIGEDDNTTGIDVITINGIDTNDSKVDDSVYNLMGRKVSKPAKGIYIKNGKKVIIK